MRRPPFLEQSGLIPPARGRRAANAARRKEMRWNRDVGLTMRQGLRLTRQQDEAWLAGFAPEKSAELARWLEPLHDDPMPWDSNARGPTDTDPPAPARGSAQR